VCKNAYMNTYLISEFSKIVGVSVKTLQRWDREKKLVPSRSLSNRRVYTEEHLFKTVGVVNKKERKVIVYTRVSSQSQKVDLLNQKKMLEQFCACRGLNVNEWIEEIGGGLNFKRPKLLKIIDLIISGNISTLVIVHKDRLSRFGFDLIEHLAKNNGCNIVVMNIETLSPEQEMIQDMLSIVHCFSSRLYGLRNYRKALKKALSDDISSQN